MYRNPLLVTSLNQNIMVSINLLTYSLRMIDSTLYNDYLKVLNQYSNKTIVQNHTNHCICVINVTFLAIDISHLHSAPASRFVNSFIPCLSSCICWVSSMETIVDVIYPSSCSLNSELLPTLTINYWQHVN